MLSLNTHCPARHGPTPHLIRDDRVERRAARRLPVDAHVEHQSAGALRSHREAEAGVGGVALGHLEGTSTEESK